MLLDGVRIVGIRLVLLLLGVRVLLRDGLLTLRVILRELDASAELGDLWLFVRALLLAVR